MIHPERSDIDINRLFKWGKEVRIYDVGNQELLSCYIRIIGDAELNRAKVYALRRSAQLRKTIKDKNSDERFAYIVDKDFTTKEELIDYILLIKGKSFGERAYKEVEVSFPKEPHSEANLETQEKFQAEVDSYSEKLNAAVRKYIEKEVDKARKELENQSFDRLYEIYEQEMINDLSEFEMLKGFKECCVFYGTYKDETCQERLFESVDQYKSLPTDIKRQFEAEYDSLEIDIETLKKLPVPMQ